MINIINYVELSYYFKTKLLRDKDLKEWTLSGCSRQFNCSTEEHRDLGKFRMSAWI